MRSRDKQTKQPEEPISPSHDRVLWLVGLYFLSGIPALVYQTAWQRVLVLHSGVGTTSVAIIVSMYMLGLGTGSLLGAKLSKYMSIHKALACFAGLEIFIAIYASITPMLLYDLLYVRGGWMYANGWLAALLHFAALALPTCAMGATLPFMTRVVVCDRERASTHIGLLYGYNTLGAAVGAALAPWILMPYLGIKGAISVAAAINCAVAVAAITLRSRAIESSQTTSGKTINITGAGRSTDPSRKSRGRKNALGHIRHGAAEPKNKDAGQILATDTPSTLDRDDSMADHSASDTRLSLWLFLYSVSGLCAVALEVLWFRILDVAVKSTSFTFGTVLGVYLACLAAGSIIGAKWSQRFHDPLRAFLLCQCGVLASAAVILVVITRYAKLGILSSWLWEYWTEYEPIRPSWSEPAASMMLYGVLPLVLMGVPTLLMGVSFCAMQRAVQREIDQSSYRVGLLQFSNILGCTVGSLLIGLWLIEALGSANCMLGLLAVGISFGVLGMGITRSRLPFLGIVVSMICLIWLLPTNRELWLALHGQASEADFYVAEDLTGVAALTRETVEGDWHLSANGKGQSSIPFGYVHSKLGALPVAIHSAPASVAIIGLGSGGTAWSALSQPNVQALRVFEICSAEAAVLESFARSPEGKQVDSLLRDRRLKIDGRDARFVLMTEETQYDIIEADAIRPHGSFAGYLYSIEFFQLCSRRLKPGGMMCSWAPTHASYATFRQVFPYVIDLDGGVVLLGSHTPIPLDQEGWRKRIRQQASYLGANVVEECVGCIDRAWISNRDLSGFPINTDLMPFDEFN